MIWRNLDWVDGNMGVIMGGGLFGAFCLSPGLGLAGVGIGLLIGILVAVRQTQLRRRKKSAK